MAGQIAKTLLMKSIIVLSLLLCGAPGQGDVAESVDQKFHCLDSDVSGDSTCQTLDIPDRLRTGDTLEPTESIKEVSQHGCEQVVCSNTDSEHLGTVETQDDQFRLPPHTTVPHASKTSTLPRQLAIERFVNTWNNLTSWPKRNPTSSVCELDVERAITSYIANELWALQMFDAWAKPGPSLLEGRSVFAGNYYQCRSTRSPTVDKREGFKGSYCVVTLANLTNTFDLNMVQIMVNSLVLLGACVPDTCLEKDITQLFQERLEAQNISSLYQAVSADCRTEKREYTIFTIIAIMVVLVIGILTFLGTVLDLAFSQKPNQIQATAGDKVEPSSSREETKVHNAGTWTKVLLSFSAYTNGKSLIRTLQHPGSIDVIPGIRFLSMSWIIMGHTYLLGMLYASNTVQGTIDMDKHRITDILNNSHLAVDTFFAISGFLVSYLTIKQVIQKGWTFNWGHFFLHRYMRLTPIYMTCFVLIQGLQKFAVSGAMAPTLQPVDKMACEKKWWMLPLYINNIYKVDVQELCFSHAWSLAADMQFYILSPLMLVPFYYHKCAGIMSCFLFVIGQWIYTGTMSYHLGGVIGLFRFSVDLYKYCYFPFYARIAPFAIGILAGYIMSVTDGRVKMKWYVVVTGWIVALTAALAVVFGVHGDLTGESPSSVLTAAIYNAASRGIWGACVCWVIVACIWGYGGPVTTFLSWPPFIVLGRLTYVGYLIHMSVIAVIFENLEQTVYLSFTSLIVFGTAALFIICIVAAVLVMCVEMPSLNLLKCFIDKKKK